MIYKIITKIMANRLTFLGTIISDEQSAFVPGRLITDNIVVAYETMHVIRRKTGGRHGLMALKLDMSPYDRVEWPLLRAVMDKLGFSGRWIDRVMDCVTTSQFSFLIDGAPMGKVVPFQGLRQGCPLSPYLFLLVAEGFSGLLRKVERDGLLVGVKCARGAPNISHIFFADDRILFGKADIESCGLIKEEEVFCKYELASRQAINL